MLIAFVSRLLVLTVGTQLVFLRSVLLTLTITAPDALCRHSLVTKGGPRAEVLAALAPLDLDVAVCNHPHSNVTSSAKTLVLTRNDVRRASLRSIVFIVRGVRKLGRAYPCRWCWFRRRCRAEASLSTHDAVPLAILVHLRADFSRLMAGLPKVIRIVLDQVVWKVYKAMKVGNDNSLGMFRSAAIEEAR